MKHSIYLLLLFFCLTACNSSNSKLKTIIAQSQSAYPEESKDGITICEGFSFDDNDNLVISYTLRENPDINYVVPKFKDELVKKSAIVTLKLDVANNANTLEILELTAKEKKNLVLTYKGNLTHKTKRISLSTKELEEIIHCSADAKTLIRESLNVQVEQQASRLPLQLSEGLVFSSIKIEENNIVYDYTMDDALAENSPIATNPSSVKQNLLNEVANTNKTSMLELFRMCIEADYGFLMRFTTAVSKKKYQISFTPKELQKNYQQLRATLIEKQTE